MMATAGATLASYCSTAKGARVPQHIGVQLWSVREDMKKDPAGTLAAIAKMGYKEVEPFGFDGGNLFGLSYSEFGGLLTRNGLTMNSVHSGMSLKNWNAGTNDITDDTKKIVDAAAKTGLRYLICPYMAAENRPDIAKMVKLFQAMGKYCQKAGLRFGYHNHDFEFTEKGPDNRLLIEWILQEVDPTLLAMEMDIYWVHHAKHNPLDWFKRFPGRWELCHAKDEAKTAKGETIEVGDGVIDFKTIFGKSKEAGLQYYVVELENYQTTPMQGIDRARQGLLKVFA